MKITILGEGKWGTTLAVIYAHKFGNVNLWVHPGSSFSGEPLEKIINSEHRNPLTFPNIALPDGLKASSEMKDVVSGADIVISAIPSEYLKPVILRLKEHDFGQFVNASKGVLDGKPISFFFSEVLPGMPYAAISGPNIAQQIISNFGQNDRLSPAFASIASNPISILPKLLESLRHIPYFRLYPASDVKSLEYCSILKQVYAVALGICVGFGYDGNTIAGMFHACGREIKSILDYLGLDPRIYDETYAGYPDLEVTYKFGRHGKFGGLIAGKGVECGLNEMAGDCLEGLEVVKAMQAQTKKSNLHLPILHEMYAVLSPEIKRSPLESVKNLVYSSKPKNI